MKKGISKISIILIIVIIGLIIAGVASIVTVSLSSPKIITVKALESVEKQIIKQIQTNKVVEKGKKVNLNGEAKLNIEIPAQTKQMLELFGLGSLIDVVNGYKYNVDSLTDVKNRNAENTLELVAPNGKSLEFKNKVINKSIRFDVIEVYLNENKINHILNAF